MKGTTYNEDYFLRGLETGKSCYSNYRWLPESTLPMVYNYVKYLNLNPEAAICDYGCSMGFTVKAFHLLGFTNTWGVDISEYAVNSADNATRKYLKIGSEGNIMPFDFKFDYIISKDVFEHIPENEIDNVLVDLAKKGSTMFAIIPLGKNDKFVIPAYSLDVTHVLAKDKDWWINKFEQCGWKLNEFSYYVKGIKENWSSFPDGNGFFLLERN